MKQDLKWIVTRIDGRIASVSADYRHFAAIARKVASGQIKVSSEISVLMEDTGEIVNLSRKVRWEDLCLSGTGFQMNVWKELFRLTHHPDGTPVLPGEGVNLLSYSQLAERCGNPRGVRAVAHAVACNPVAYIIPCHLIIPKESVDRISEIRAVAQNTIFKGADLFLLDSIDFGEYAYGKRLKRDLIALQLTDDIE